MLEQFIRYINGKYQRNWHKNGAYYFFNDMININVDPKSYKNIDIYYIEYITIKDISDYETILKHCKNFLFYCWWSRWIHWRENANKYLVFALLTKYMELWNGIQKLIKTIDDKPGEYGKDFMNIKFNSDDNLPLNKILKLHNLTIVVRSVFQEKSRYYPQVFLDECLYELEKCYNKKDLMFQKKLTLINQKNVWFVITVILKILVINLSHMSVINAMIYQWWFIIRKYCNTRCKMCRL